MYALSALLAASVFRAASAQGYGYSSGYGSGYSSGTDMSSLFGLVDSGCGTSGPVSCSNTTAEKNLCCFQAPGGLLLQTQFWDTNPSTGPSNSWTIHGLWPDNCDGTYQENCDSSRDYTDISTLLTNQGASDTLSYMKEFWVDINGQNEQFWEHEWSTHGTCMSTLEPSCLPSGSAKGAEAVAFFQIVVNLFKTLPTYDWLEQAGITPSSSKTYTLSQMTSALKSGYGFTPALDCSSGSVSSISYYYHLKGSLLDGELVPINAPSAGSCKSGSVKYATKTGTPTTSGTPPKTTSKPGSTSTKTSSPSPTITSAPGGDLPSSGTIQAITDDGVVGGLLGAGTWSTQTLGTYTLSGSSSGFTMSSKKGKCGISSGALTCGSGTSAATFTAVDDGDGNLLIAYQGDINWSSDTTPDGSAQETVYTGSGEGTDFNLAIVSS
ncbi:ribonuclease [Artomyces pyxidatus]|uniref:Ribonuclease n=1 Tax=Artomyces pyxidatus TaxID=48021 RepID=A0ACB8STA3_9AGAM|nr:ribonuclease [Artomyces pyxidatus]